MNLADRPAFHFADADNSERLQRLEAFLRSRQGNPPTTVELTGNPVYSMNPARDCNELKRNGRNVRCEYVGMNGNGRRVFVWKID